MLKMKSANENGNDLNQVIQALVKEIQLDGTKLVIFFNSPKYDTGQTGKLLKQSFPNAEVIGCTTAGEISNKGFTENSISAISIAADDFDVATYVMKDIKTKTMLTKEDLLATGSKIGLTADSRDGLIISLIDNTAMAEEKVLGAVSHAFFNLKLVGGSASGDQQAFVSLNGEVYQNAAIITFIKTTKFFTYKENIFIPTETELQVTKADIMHRIVYEFNEKPAAMEYARVLGLSMPEFLKNQTAVFFTNPVGRIFGDEVWISAPFSVVEGNGIKFTALITPHTVVKLLKPADPVAEARKTAQIIQQNMPHPQGLILFNCMLRYLQFKNENLCPTLAVEYNRCGSICGFNTYGEQLNKLHINQTLTLVAFGE
ncbi:MAG TPA: hypothetical protein DDW50_22340 [Firmicutes bacterium]|jgi:hypothetical protein|nr:hypothetical protein [Bacillota bacterium]